MSDDKLRILELIQSGKLTASEGLDLLSAVEDSGEKSAKAPAATEGRYLRVRVSGEKGMKANVNIPLPLLKAAAKLAGVGVNLIPKEARTEMENKGIDLTRLDIDELVRLIDTGLSENKLVDVDVEDPKEGKIKVDVYVD